MQKNEKSTRLPCNISRIVEQMLYHYSTQIHRVLELGWEMLSWQYGSVCSLSLRNESVWCSRGPASRYTMLRLVSVHLHGGSFSYEQAHPTRSTGCTLDHLHPSVKRRHHFRCDLLDVQQCCRVMRWFKNVPFKCVLAFCSEKVNVRLELQFEDVLLVDAVWLLGGADRVAEQREASQREIILPTNASVISVRCTVIHEESKRAGSPDESCRRTSRSWWKRPKVSASRCCSWISSGGNQKAGSTQRRKREVIRDVNFYC